MPKQHKSRVLIVGSGPAGYTAAIYAARANLAPILVRGLQPGGQLTITADVENYPGFPKSVNGPELMDQFAEQAERSGTRIFDDTIVSADFGSRPFRCVGDGGDEYVADTVIIATGARARWLGIEPQELQGRGISGCAVCDGAFFRGQDVAVIGGGNAAVEEALYLSRLARRVTLIHRRDSLRAEKVLQERLFKNEKIEILWNRKVDAFVGNDASGLNALKLADVQTGDVASLPVTGAFVAIGHVPETAVFRGQITTDDEGYIVVKPGTTETNVRGVWAAGDVADKKYRQAVTAAGMGCMAALEVERFLSDAPAT